VELLFKIGFLEIRFLDIVDFLLVGFLLYQIYKLLRGSLAFNIFLGLLLIYLLWWLVKTLNMQLLAGILDQFISVGVIALLIVFQPEVRRFLLFIGKGSILKKGGLWRRLSFSKDWGLSAQVEQHKSEIILALNNLSKAKTGAIIVFAKTSKLQFFANTGVIIDGIISSKLLESIFDKKSPLHDGAIIIAGNKVTAANCVLPVSENPDLPSRIGLRHKAAVGITEHSDATAIIVSEEKGNISYAKEGKLKLTVNEQELDNIITKALADE